MKHILLFLLMIPFSICIVAQQSPAEQVASRIAQKMKDSLVLTETQREQVYNVNIQLSNQKQAARASATDPDELGRQLQQIENTRDGLYQPILGEEKFMLYKQKKMNLVSN
jgi:type IV pilus biogenesis protein CpaD/CtpE